MPFTTTLRHLLPCAVVLSSATAHAAITGPYTADGDTLHLWHLDEADPGPAVPAAGVTGSFNLTPDAGKSPGSPATLGNTSFAGFGTSADTSAGQGSGMKGSSISPGALTGANGAFTFEAIINIPSINTLQMIIGMDSNASNSLRPFQFRIDNGQLRFINIAGSTIGQHLGVIPTTGEDAFVANEWFHVAVTYDGNENTSDNIKFYWTRMDDSRTEANLVASDSDMVEDLSGNSAIFGAGNDYRTSGSGNTNNLEGRIDEVRISSIARSSDDFLFAVPEPSSLALIGIGGLLVARRRR